MTILLSHMNPMKWRCCPALLLDYQLLTNHFSRGEQIRRYFNAGNMCKSVYGSMGPVPTCSAIVCNTIALAYSQAVPIYRMTQPWIIGSFLLNSSKSSGATALLNYIAENFWGATRTVPLGTPMIKNNAGYTGKHTLSLFYSLYCSVIVS